MQRQDMAYRRHTHSKKQPAKSRCPARVQAALHKARNSFIMPTRFHHRTAL